MTSQSFGTLSCSDSGTCVSYYYVRVTESDSFSYLVILCKSDWIIKLSYLVVWSAAILARFFTAPSNWVLKVVNICTSLSTKSWLREQELDRYCLIFKQRPGQGVCQGRWVQRNMLHQQVGPKELSSVTAVRTHFCHQWIFSPFQLFSSHFSNAFHPCKLGNGSTPGKC